MKINRHKIRKIINTFLEQRVIPLPRQHKLAIAGLVMVIPCLAFYFLIYGPKTGKIQQLSTTRAKLQTDINKIRKAADMLEQHQAEMAATRDLFAQAARLLPEKQEIPSLLTAISDHGMNSGLEFLSFVPRPEIARDFYAEIPVDIKVRGPYHNVGIFLDQISKLPRIVTVANIKMGGSAEEGDDIMLNTSFNLLTYRFSQQPAPAKDEKKGK